MAKPRIERSLLFPNKEFRERVRKASKDRGFRSEQAFILAEVRYYLCCGTPRRCAPSGARSRQVALRQADPRCGERALEQKQRHSEGDGSR